MDTCVEDFFSSSSSSLSVSLFVVVVVVVVFFLKEANVFRQLRVAVCMVYKGHRVVHAYHCFFFFNFNFIQEI